ncbi:nicotinate phosphoribosyltransferase [Blastopirellula sp. JC732]|uniref:Nicotinate phosphoribosyltransferase n=1 Tax=Blastopirellula sediminis TaxID=2894196 RepID=A0A9X1MJ19_9BACT|nr:nicotinate phosphoribosyltransferase [Blastopirellula sediminis]MCC9609230.1 nicotinate phosphoribosyltransferase [Blastopirellula sediminis]MCC9627993.1 nicotinate phosphoribosyltransferase [Blastopirellula sediminis]
MLPTVYRGSLALLTDLYQLTMAYGYWKRQRADRLATFHLYFRKLPFQGGYAVAAGLELAIDYLRQFRFDDEDLGYLATLRGNDDRPLFEEGFFDYLAELRFTGDLEAIAEGTVVFPNEPLVRVTAPLLVAQLLETPLLNLINFSTLIATKSARICQAAEGESVLEFGLRRAQGIDGGLTGARAAFIGGAAATSNVLAGKILGIPVRGTHAHSWVMAYGDEREAFADYAAAMPNNCVFLVDTYDTLEGVRHAIEAGEELRRRGHKMVGIRLDSGDLAYLSIEARRLLDEAGFPEAAIVGSSDLDEYLIQSLKQQGAKISVWGVGTRLATAYDQPALGGVYKLSAIQNERGEWEHRIKLSEQRIKTTIPGRLQVRRYSHDGRVAGDLMFDELLGEPDGKAIVDPADPLRRKKLSANWECETLLTPVFRQGEVVYQNPTLLEMQARTKAELARFHPSVRRLLNPHGYPVGIDQKLFKERERMIHEASALDEEE